MTKGKENQQIRYLTDIRCNGDDCNILTIGTKVRVKLSQPKDLSSDRTLSERFRATDTYWDPFPRKFLDIMLMPGQPPLYRVSVHDNPDEIDHRAAYTKKQLQIVHENEVAPNPEAIRGNPESYIAVKVVDKKKEIGFITKLDGEDLMLIVILGN